MRRAGRLRELLFSGIVDSFGMALGWTFIVLIATARGGLAEAALLNAAMLVGVVLSAPVTGWLSRHLDGRTLLRGAAGIEVLLRFGTLNGLIAGWPSWLVALLVALQHVAAWAGFAGMRAEVSAVDASPRSMTRYAVAIAGVEAAGTALAAMLPTGTLGHPTGWLLTAVYVVYLGSLLPTVLIARRARIAPSPIAGRDSAPARWRHAATPPATPAPWRLPQPRLLLAGAGIMLLASGPTLLAIPVTSELHGERWVAVSAIAFCIGTLLATRAVAVIGRLRLPAVLRWSLWGLGMLAGWILAPAHAFMVVVAQFAAGLSQTAFEGDMDARVAAGAKPESVTRDLAYSASVRALGGAISVRLLPMLVAAPAIGVAASGAALILGVLTLTLWAGLTTAPHIFRRVAHG
ncbi:hypothetical protein [Paractinoplanes lichenicola]|uniref:MFS transporter n=1 Tax=Paractinoplanes lichenicola TaxID=2802976 RepID=A0ABS1VH41_9ACTN|nr:hypothetical protein [Actinoplanes lichenicola]MBL7253999.1 hypothetical protein [Actinoplanes lichenicola]